MPFSRGKQGFLYQKTKKGKEKKQKIINKEGSGPSEVALWATPLDP